LSIMNKEVIIADTEELNYREKYYT
jgi:hypothetical protein